MRDALNNGVISQSQFNQLIRYNGVKRPDIHPEFSKSYKEDRNFLTKHVFSTERARTINDEYNNNYISNDLQRSVNGFLGIVQDKWGSESVFDPAHPDYEKALTAMASISNRTGNLNASTRHFVSSQPKTLSDVKARYDGVLGDHWFLVERAASQLEGR